MPMNPTRHAAAAKPVKPGTHSSAAGFTGHERRVDAA
ncbi:hypothetical protein J2S67_001613 [Pseudoglutamicibacter albus]|uniref:Uncharacterized protein n=1 Tax=Pseudoglutamicibacter albus TaxID=98671 RepID=A0ABU1Z2V8_9MICC|nr:hypothetical protein [Pseudoglutamicibacter albus]